MKDSNYRASCTTILVGKNATYDGSTMMTRVEDASDGKFNPKKHIVVKPSEQPRHYKSTSSNFEIDLPDHPIQYTSMPDANPIEGIFGAAGINIKNVAVTATETITSNALVLGADPLVEAGIGEEDILTVVLPYIESARKGVERLGSILEKYGTCEMNGIGFQDENEIWYLETIGGHHFIAKRVSDDSYVVGPNQQGIKTFDFVDAFGEKKNHICSNDLIDFIVSNQLNLSFTVGKNLKEEKEFDARAAFGSHTDSDRVYNTPRAWFMHKYLSPKKYKWEGPEADFTPESEDIPWSLIPDHKITVDDIKYVMSSYYQNTKYNPYGKYGDLSEAGKYRPIGINRNNFVILSQIRGYTPDEIKAVEWIAVGSGIFNAFMPQYARVNDSPIYIKETTGEVTTNNFYWTNRMIGALADAHYNDTRAWVDRYQKKMAAKGHEFINKFDQQYKNGTGNASKTFLEDANNEIADFTKKETSDLLGKVLFTASLKMKNAFSRSDA
jgi:dipeptidase